MTDAMLNEHHLIDMIYASLFGDSSWQDFLDAVALATGDKAVLLRHDADGAAGYIALTSGFDNKSVQAYNSYYAARNILQTSLARYHQPGIGIVDELLYPREDLVRTEFYNDFLTPNGIRSTIGLKIVEYNRNIYSLVTTSRSDYVDRDCGIPRLHVICPHRVDRLVC